jgi:hypothetical protein
MQLLHLLAIDEFLMNMERGFKRLSYLVVNCFKITANQPLPLPKSVILFTFRLLTIMVSYGQIAQKEPMPQMIIINHNV